VVGTIDITNKVSMTFTDFYMEGETLAQTIDRLEREVAHVTEQARVSHAMAMTWRTRAKAAEEQCWRLDRRLQRKGATAPPEPLTGEDADEALSVPSVR
jgi:hypothetical protein